MRFLTFLILVGVSSGISANTPVKPCEVGILPVVKVTSTTECFEDPCEVESGHDVTMQLNFTSPRYLDNIVPKVIAHTDVMDFPYPLAQKDACEGISNTPCPIVENERIQYAFSISLFKGLPKITLPVEFSIVDKKDTADEGDDEAVVCFIINLKVKN